MTSPSDTRIWEYIGYALSLAAFALFSTGLYVFLWLHTSITENVHRKFAGTSHSDLLEKFENRGFHVLSRGDGHGSHLNGLSPSPVAFLKGKGRLKAACPQPDCTFHAAIKSTPYLGWLQKYECAAWASRDGTIVAIVGKHSPMLGNL